MLRKLQLCFWYVILYSCKIRQLDVKFLIAKKIIRNSRYFNKPLKIQTAQCTVNVIKRQFSQETRIEKLFDNRNESFIGSAQGAKAADYPLLET